LKASLRDLQRNLWLSLLRYGLVPPQFPREMQTSRMLVNNERQYINVIEKAGFTDCFTAVYTDWQKRNSVVDTIFLETDYSTRDEADKKHEEILSWFRQKGIHVRTLFSGRRSYHYYIDFPPTKVSDFKASVLNWVANIPGDFDPAVVGNLAQMARIPGTLHGATGLFCVPVNSIATSEKCTELFGSSVQIIIPNPIVAEELLGIKISSHSPRKSLLESKIENGAVPPCILAIMRFAKNTGQASHQQRLHLTAYLLKVIGPQASLEFFKETMSDFRAQYSAYQIEYLRKREWGCYKCETARMNGLCPLQNTRCSFYPSINWHI